MILPFNIGHIWRFYVCVQVDLADVVSVNRQGGYWSGHFFLSQVGYPPEGSSSVSSSYSDVIFLSLLSLSLVFISIGYGVSSSGGYTYLTLSSSSS